MEKEKKDIFIPILLLRPLLGTTRFDLKKLCQIWSLPIYPDVTNQNLTSTRNRIRLQLLPILRFFFNPQIDVILTQFAQINLQEQDYLHSLTTRLIKDFFSKKKVLQNKSASFYDDLSYQQNCCFYQVETRENGVKPLSPSQSNKANIALHFVSHITPNVSGNGVFLHPSKRIKSCRGFEKTHFVLYFAGQIYAGQKKLNLYQTKTIPREIENSSSYLLYKFEFQNQPLFFFPLTIQKRISKKLIEYFLNKKIHFFHVEHIIKYLKDSQNLF